MHVIGLVGEKGSGKGTFARILEECVPIGKRVERIRFSDVLRETLALWHLPPSRSNLQHLSKAFDAEFGNGTLAHAVAHRVAESSADVVVLDGMRWIADGELVRSFSDHCIVYVTASASVRFQRLCTRGENAGERHATYEQFLEEEQAISERAIATLGARATVRIVNEGSIDELREQAHAVVRRMYAFV